MTELERAAVAYFAAVIDGLPDAHKRMVDARVAVLKAALRLGMDAAAHSAEPDPTPSVGAAVDALCLLHIGHNGFPQEKIYREASATVAARGRRLQLERLLLDAQAEAR